METVYIKTSTRIAAITGDVNGVSEITVLKRLKKCLLKSSFLARCSATSKFQFSKELI
jgi:hypothetical protein